MRVSALALALMALAAPARAERLVIDLAKGIAAETLSRPHGTVMRFVVQNRVPTETYKVVVDVRSMEITALQTPKVAPFSTTDDDPCKRLLTDVTAVYAAKAEAALGAPMARIREARAADTCKNNTDMAMRLQKAVDETEYDVPGEYEVRAGQEIVVTIARGENAWVRVISGGPRGKWLTTYGAAIVPDRSRKMSLKGDAATGFVITPEAEPDGPRVLPSVFFTWMPTAAQARDWAHGPTAGLGVDKAPGLFAGWSATYNQNLTFLAGLALAQHKRLRGQYAPGETLKQSLEADQLLEGVYKPTWMIGITFRFGDNPFSGAATRKPAGRSDGTGRTDR